MTELSKETRIERLQVKLLFVTVGEECMKHLKDGKQKISSLFSIQQKAATQMFMHSADSGKDSWKTIIIVPSDTDSWSFNLSPCQKKSHCFHWPS